MLVTSCLEQAAAYARGAQLFDGEPLAARFKEIAAAFTRPPKLVVVGEFNAGKSTLINRLLGVDVLPTDVLPATARPALIQHGERPWMVLNRRGGLQDLRSLDELRSYGNKADPSHDTLGMAEIASLDVFLPNPLLKEVRLLDTPGISDLEQDHDLTLSAVSDADAVVWCTMASQGWKDSEAQFWERIPADVRKTAILVITHADALNSDEERSKVARRLSDQMRSLFAKMLMISTHPRHTTLGDGLASVQAAIKESVIDRGHVLRSGWARRRAVEAVELALHDERARVDELKAVCAEIGEASKGMRSDWSHTRQKIEHALTHTADQIEELFDHAASGARAIVTRLEFREPKVKINKGLLFDDHRVVWRTRWMEDLDWEKIDSVHDNLAKSADRICSKAESAIHDALEKYALNYVETLEPHLHKLGMCSDTQIGLLHQYRFALAAQVRGAFHRAMGSVECGGLHAFSAIHTKQRDHRKRLPDGRELREALESVFSFDVAAKICRSAIAMLDEVTKEVSVWLERGETMAEEAEAKFRAIVHEAEGIRAILDGSEAAAANGSGARAG
jgi:hypothetical protein